MMNITEYKQRVMNHFQKVFTDISKVTQEDWELLTELFSEASEDGDIEEFDKRILTEQEFKELYEIDQPEWVTEPKQEEQTFKDGLQEAEDQGI